MKIKNIVILSAVTGVAVLSAGILAACFRPGSTPKPSTSIAGSVVAPSSSAQEFPHEDYYKSQNLPLYFDDDDDISLYEYPTDELMDGNSEELFKKLSNSFFIGDEMVHCKTFFIDFFDSILKTPGFDLSDSAYSSITTWLNTNVYVGETGIYGYNAKLYKNRVDWFHSKEFAEKYFVTLMDKFNGELGDLKITIETVPSKSVLWAEDYVFNISLNQLQLSVGVFDFFYITVEI